MLRKLASSILFRATVIAVFTAQLVYLLHFPRHKCSDLSFDLQHPNRTVTVTPVNPEATYSDLLTFTYHQQADFLSLNNANCQLQISKVSGMSRKQLQFLKPHLIKAVIQRSRSPHVGYIDWDGNFVRRPWNPPTDLVVLSNPVPNSTNTGFLLFFNKEKHIKTIDAWIEQEIPTSHDQWTWALMERATNIPVYRTEDGEFGEGYNWNARDKPRTTVRCARVIFHLTWFRALLDVGIILFVIVKVYDAWSMHTKNHCPRRVYLTFLIITSITLSVYFKEQYHQQRGFEPRYFGERICGIPGISLQPDGSIVSRQETTTSPNPFLAVVIKTLGLDIVTTFTSFWFILLARMRTLARVVLLVEIVSLASMGCVTRAERAESGLWCALVTLRDFGNGGNRIARVWKDGLLRSGVVDAEHAELRPLDLGGKGFS